ncbi:MAG: DUF5808 domain-containing protein [Halobacteriales archaeon]
MVKRDSSGSFLGVPYNFEAPKLSRMLKAYWQPGEGMLVPKPLGVGYSLNLANWRSWVVIAVAVALTLRERSGGSEASEEEPAQEPVDVMVDD